MRVNVRVEPEIVAKHFSSTAVPGLITTKNGTPAADGQPVVAAIVMDPSPEPRALVMVVWAAAPLYCFLTTAAIRLLSYTTHDYYGGSLNVIFVVGIGDMAGSELDILDNHGEGLRVFLIVDNTGGFHQVSQKQHLLVYVLEILPTVNAQFVVHD
jgi:hypothetical protein